MDWWSFGLGAVSGVVLPTVFSFMNHRLNRRTEQRTLVDREQAASDQDRAAHAQARNIDVTLRPSGNVAILKIANKGQQPVHNVELLDARRENADPAETWEIVPPRESAKHDVLEGRRSFKRRVALVDASGVRIERLSGMLNYQVQFCDGSGQWWITDREGPKQRDFPAP